MQQLIKSVYTSPRPKDMYWIIISLPIEREAKRREAERQEAEWGEAERREAENRVAERREADRREAVREVGRKTREAAEKERKRKVLDQLQKLVDMKALKKAGPGPVVADPGRCLPI